MKLHEKIRFLRAFKGLNQEQMAEKLNLSPNAYSKVEQGKTDITPERLEKIANILDMTADDIKTFEERLVFNNFENKDSIINKYIAENFEKERESYKAHIADLKEQITNLEAKHEKQVASLEKQIENLYNLLQAR